MVKLVRDDPESAPDDLVPEVDRVEDTRTIWQRLRVAAAQGQEFLRMEIPGAADTVERAYWSYRLARAGALAPKQAG